MEAIAFEQPTKEGTNVKIKVNDKITLWFDFWVKDGDLEGDYNKYIFNPKDSNDKRQFTYQQDADNFTECFECGEAYLKEQGVLIETDDKYTLIVKD